MFNYPDVPDKLAQFRSALMWATGCEIVWKNQNDGGRVRESNKVWGELTLLSILGLGVDEIRNEETGTVSCPRVETLCGHRILNFQLDMRSRSQDHPKSAWYRALRAQTRMRYPYVRTTYLTPFEMSINTVSQILNNSFAFDNRVEDVAILEFAINTVLNDQDAATVGTWIEHIEVTSDFKNAGGVSWDSSLQLTDEVMP